MTTLWIADGSRVLLDTVTVIYVLERHPRYGPMARQVLERVEAVYRAACEISATWTSWT